MWINKAFSVKRDFLFLPRFWQKKFYNLDAIIAVGYRVNSIQATHFRIWATAILKEYIIKGFAMDDERLKNPYHIFGKDYFEEQLARVRDIRSSERRFYQKITDIYAQCSVDYNKDSDTTQQFFATVQNKLHWAISHKMAAEICFDDEEIFDLFEPNQNEDNCICSSAYTNPNCHTHGDFN